MINNNYFQFKKFSLCILIAFLYSFLLLNAQNVSISEGEPIPYADSKVNSLDEPSFLKLESTNLLSNKNESSITIKTNETGASVYLNGNYQGITPLSIKNLTQGRYRLRIEKNHYETREMNIHVRKGQERVYTIELQKITGQLLFDLKPADASVVIDNSSSFGTTAFTLSEGTHSVTVKRFGYTQWSSGVQVYKNMSRRIYVELTPAPFEIKSFSLSKSSFNPRNAGSLGQTEFLFSVTTSASGILTITDSKGNTVWSTSYSSFSTWNNSTTWDGRNQDGFIVSDGQYTATLTLNNIVTSCSLKIDSSISYPQLSITSDGTGLGTVSSAQMYPKDTMLIHFGFGPSFNLSSKTFYSAPLSIQFGWGITENIEFSLLYDLQAGISNTSTISGAIKFGGSLKHGQSNSFCYSLNIRFGYAQSAIYEPYGYDFGTGLGTGVAIGFDTGFIYTGLSSEFIYKPVKGVFTEGSDLCWKNGLIFQVRNNFASLGVFAALNSGFGEYSFTDTNEDIVYTDSINGMYRALDTGIDGKIYFSNSSISATLKAGTIIYSTNLYLYCLAGITITF